MLKETSLAYAELLKQVSEHNNGSDAAMSGGWKTAVQWGELWGVRRARSGELIKKLVVGGLWECKRFNTDSPLRGSYPVPYYRPIKNEKASTRRKSR